MSRGSGCFCVLRKIMKDKIIIKGAREHNLKNINLEIPRDKMVVFTGLSGSGKSSLAFDTIFAEGQRRYIESLSAYARQFLGRLDKPDVDDIEGRRRFRLTRNRIRRTRARRSRRSRKFTITSACFSRARGSRIAQSAAVRSRR